MFSDFKKSISSIFYDRVASPFWGTLTSSWLVWNWKIIVLLFFVSEDKLPKDKATGLLPTKVDYIIINYSNSTNLFIGPLLSTIIIITLIPFLVNGSYWLTIKFKKWRLDKKNEVEMRQLLTVEQSLQLRTEIKNQEKKIQSLLEEKDILISSQSDTIKSLQSDFSERVKLVEQLRQQNENQKFSLTEKEKELEDLIDMQQKLISDNNRKEEVIKDQIAKRNEIQLELNEMSINLGTTQKELDRVTRDKQKLIEDYNRISAYREKFELEQGIQKLLDNILSHKSLETSLNTIAFTIQNYRGNFAQSPTNISITDLAFFEGNSLIEQNGGKYNFTPFGKELLRLYSKNKLAQNES